MKTLVIKIMKVARQEAGLVVGINISFPEHNSATI